MFQPRPNPIPKAAPAWAGRRHGPAAGQITVLRVGALPGERARGRVIADGLVIRCALGPAGITRRKREGDGATPAGHFSLSAALVRADRVGRPLTRLPLKPLAVQDGWCDDPASSRYNRPVRRPFGGRHETLWRDDALYDCIVVIDFNTQAVRKGGGSAIFLHVAAPDLAPTAGCVAVPRPTLLRLLRRIGPRTRIAIG